MTTCRHCGRVIEESNGAWWGAGGCDAICDRSPVRRGLFPPHEPRLPDLTDRPAVEAWLDA